MSWRRFFRRRKWDEERARELALYLVTETEENIARGMTREEASRAAHIKLGNATRIREEIYEMNSIRFIETLWQDLRYGARMLRKSPGFTIVAVLTLALGIGANTAIFSLVDGVLLRPLPYPQADQIVHLSWQVKGGAIPNLNAPEYEFCRDHSTSFAVLAGVRDLVDRELTSGDTKQWVKALYVTDGFFETLGVNPELGRGFVRRETLPNGPYAVVLTDKLWRSVYGADANIVGRQIVLDNRSYTVTGVAPPGFKFTEPADLFISLHLGNGVEDMGTNTDVIGRLKSGVSEAQAQAEMPVLGKEFWAQISGLERQSETQGYIHLDPYQSWLAGDYRMSLLMLLSAVGLLLLIACANVASLLLARANSRQKEISIRLALGATRGRLLAQFLTESLLLGSAGAAAGLAGAVTILRVVVSAIPWELPVVDRIGLDGRVLFFTLSIGIGASIAFGLVSFLQTRKVDLNSTLKDGRTIAGVGRGRGRFLGALVVGEVAISLMLALGAGLLIESLYNLYQEKLGFDPTRVVLMETPFAPGTAAASHPWDFERQALARIQAIPGVQSAAIVSVAPLNGQRNLPAQRDGHPEDSIGGTEYRAISSDYFSTMGISIMRGRGFQESDFGSSAPGALINETLARDWWPGQNPIGGRIVVGEFRGQKIPQILEAPREIIGVVADVKGLAIDRPAPPMVYVPASQAAGIMNGSTDWVVRTSATAGIASTLRKAVTDVAPGQRIIDLEPMTQLIGASVAQPNFEGSLMGMFGGLALLLTLVGVYGVLNFQVGQRTHEIGIRMALGANRRDVTRLVIAKAAMLAALGILIGIAAAFGLTRLMGSLLYEVRPTDPAIFAGIAILVLVVAMLAAYLPARRAMRVDPMVALRHE